VVATEEVRLRLRSRPMIEFIGGPRCGQRETWGTCPRESVVALPHRLDFATAEYEAPPHCPKQRIGRYVLAPKAAWQDTGVAYYVWKGED
jgi:hypothetical protein